jgi:hypothetical protein
MGRPRGSSPPKGKLQGEPPSLGASMASDMALSAAFYHRYAQSFRTITQRLPVRTTARQAFAFLLIVQMNAGGHTVTAKRLRDLAGRDELGEEVLGQSIQRTYQVFLEKSDHNPDGVGWIYTEIDTEDRRNNFLKLTEMGLKVATEVQKWL